MKLAVQVKNEEGKGPAKLIVPQLPAVDKDQLNRLAFNTGDLFVVIIMDTLSKAHVYLMYKLVTHLFTLGYGPFRCPDGRNLRFSPRFSNEALQLSAVCVDSAHNERHLRAHPAITVALK